MIIKRKRTRKLLMCTYTGTTFRLQRLTFFLSFQNYFIRYAFGIILWEFLERVRPYYDQHFRFPNELLNFVANGGRPKFKSRNDTPNDYISLMKNCWKQTAFHRPRFDDIVKSVDRIILVYETDAKKSESEEKESTSTKDGRGTERYSPLV